MPVKTTGWPSVDKLLKEADELHKEYAELELKIDKHLSKFSNPSKPLHFSSLNKFQVVQNK